LPLAPQAPSAPYDTLATVTALVRVDLGDFIQNIQPNNSGVVNVNAGGLSIMWVSGNRFTALMNGCQIIINGLPNTIAMVTSPTTANLVTQAAVAGGLNYSLVIPTGDIFADNQNYVLPTINLAWRKLQKKLADKGHPRVESEALLTNLPIVGSLDPASECWINWSNFFDGVTLWSPATLAGCPVLPQDFIAPLRLKERPYVSGEGANGVVNFTQLRSMHPAPNSLKGRQKGTWNRYWDWREDAIYFPGSIVPMDLWSRYNAFLPDIAVAAGGFGSTPIPIMRSAEALAHYAAALFVTPRGSLLGPNFEAAGDMAVSQITNAFAKLEQRASYSRKAWGRRFRRTRTM
jgi:hypothetical protein